MKKIIIALLLFKNEYIYIYIYIYIWGVLLNIDNRDNRLGATTISIIDIYFSFSIIIDMLWH